MDAAEGANSPEKELNHGSLLVLYGTETGHSQEIAEEISDCAERLRIPICLEQMNDVSLNVLLQSSLAVFVTSTTGQGDMPNNATAFWKSLLRKKLPPKCLEQLHFTIFGLGDSSYPKFNWAARKLQKRLLQLGAIEVYPAGEGDEKHDNGIDSIYLPWLQGLKTHLSKQFPLPSGISPLPDDELLPPKYPIGIAKMDLAQEQPLCADDARWVANLEKHAASSHIHHPKSTKQEDDDRDLRRNDIYGLGQLARSDMDAFERLTIDGRKQLDADNVLKDPPSSYDLNPLTGDVEGDGDDGLPPNHLLPIPGTYEVRLLSNDRVTPSTHWQDVRLLTLEKYVSEDEDENERAEFYAGDTITLFPKNFPADVEKIIQLMDWEEVADSPVLRMDSPEEPLWPRDMYPLQGSSLRQILLNNLDFNAIPSRTFLKQLRRHTNDEREKERLMELTQEANTQEFYDYTSRPRRTILEVLEDFPGVKVPMSYALETFPVIRGREFSIANCSHTARDEGSGNILIEVLVALVEYKTIIRKPRQGLCSRYIKTLKAGTPLVIGFNRGHPPASGLTASKRPLIAIATGTGIAPIRSLIQQRGFENSRPNLMTMLFYGCRNKDADFHFKDEWSEVPRLRVIPAFSRDPVGKDEVEFQERFAQQTKSMVGVTVTNGVPEPVGPLKTPWIRSYDYDRGKMYVQHQIRRHASDICQLIKAGLGAGYPPIIMICGNAGRMPVSVRLALEDALVIGGLAPNSEEAKKQLQVMGIWMETW
ncbi:hypothetical protein BD289DRAFT_373696 [Coniella lustricola]|uniref:Uncharacterized protein n=1 Tax=Coniella lustricola TaxID=2025994 RepID=A0A2T3A0K9_9PEZI|nr:hypothetical protein BD289DRAFT_373696 [Coniella lustricola]